MNNDLIGLIDKSYPKMSKGHKKIATFIKEHYDKAAFMTALKFGQTVGVSESTVVRFATALGFDGYSDMQKAIEELARIKSTPNQRIEITKMRLGDGDIIEKVMEADIHKIRYTLENINRDDFNNSVSSILNAKNIYIMGVRSSEPIAKILHYNLSLIFDNVKFVNSNSTAEVFEQMFSIGSDDLLIAFSFPRYSSRIVNAVKFAHSKGASVIGFTDSRTSPIADFTNYLLAAKSDMASYMDSLVAPISIINAIIVEITRRNECEIIRRFETLEGIWDEYNVYAKK